MASDLPVPDADDLNLQGLVDKTKRTLPPLTLAWADDNVRHPAITLLEQCVVVFDKLSYLTSQLPDAHREKLLALMAQAPEGTKTAQASPLAKDLLTKLLKQ
ncbi:hypothetical protein [Streptomyces telluris]|uniref:Uncharacterized protein n=1 Tax=Streptomyces telluris TaxID=2720021 RepID=A0A9X2LST6_9ACTN|nr:hypothetical protein [Streptomyces telluris]MCQ8775070.1 hypothetical protein [Streptomyces telluris]NJP82378.1 hypothetical protein [Streptomyces telluris]